MSLQDSPSEGRAGIGPHDDDSLRFCPIDPMASLIAEVEQLRAQVTELRGKVAAVENGLRRAGWILIE